jgi:hypothetical protein
MQDDRDGDENGRGEKERIEKRETEHLRTTAGA